MDELAPSWPGDRERGGRSLGARGGSSIVAVPTSRRCWYERCGSKSRSRRLVAGSGASEMVRRTSGLVGCTASSDDRPCGPVGGTNVSGVASLVGGTPGTACTSPTRLPVCTSHRPRPPSPPPSRHPRTTWHVLSPAQCMRPCSEKSDTTLRSPCLCPGVSEASERALVSWLRRRMVAGCGDGRRDRWQVGGSGCTRCVRLSESGTE
mmetsp:Transcript_5314/g.17115  ORF Transcript_5314/g.17115 Transcript_5314/m.17115 type:complete len:207 (+) Transcript_5314:1638-2258(+)